MVSTNNIIKFLLYNLYSIGIIIAGNCGNVESQLYSWL